MLRLNPEGYLRFLQADRFLVNYTGAEANVCVSLAMMGMDTDFVTRLPENDIAAYPSDKAIQLAGDGLTEADIAEKREMGGWDPRTDPLMRTNEQGDWTGVTQQQADQLVWDNRDEILARASYDSELSTWTLHQLDQLKEPQPAQSLDRDRPEPDHKAPAQADSTTKRHGPRL